VHKAASKKDEWKKSQAADGATVSKDGVTATKDGVTSTKDEDPNAMVGRCRLTVSKPVLTAPMGAALEGTI